MLIVEEPVDEGNIAGQHARVVPLPPVPLTVLRDGPGVADGDPGDGPRAPGRPKGPWYRGSTNQGLGLEPRQRLRRRSVKPKYGRKP